MRVLVEDGKREGQKQATPHPTTEALGKKGMNRSSSSTDTDDGKK